ncbi:MAG: bis-aminopropyl spermidine synthase family protein, partial [Leptonema sp. (in: bacteria)]
ENVDFVFFDPPYTPQAVKLWLISALQIILGKGSNQKRKDLNFLKKKFIFMCYCYTDKALERGLKIQKIITDLGIIIQEKFRKFNKYTGAESINNESDLFVLQPTPKIDLKLIDSLRKKEFKEKIYTWEQI